MLVMFVGGATGAWRVERQTAIAGRPLAPVSHLDVLEEGSPPDAIAPGVWILRGATSHERYVTRYEHDELARRQQPLGRPEATSAALIPVRKSDEWWLLAQDERRAIFEETSHHVATGLEYLPEVARRLHHSRDLGEEFDFLTWFEYAPEHAGRFEDLLRRLRATEEWAFVEREVDIRLSAA